MPGAPPKTPSAGWSLQCGFRPGMLLSPAGLRRAFPRLTQGSEKPDENGDLESQWEVGSCWGAEFSAALCTAENLLPVQMYPRDKAGTLPVWTVPPTRGRRGDERGHLGAHGRGMRLGNSTRYFTRTQSELQLFTARRRLNAGQKMLDTQHAPQFENKETDSQQSPARIPLSSFHF